VQQAESSALRHLHAASGPVAGAGLHQPNPSVHQLQALPPRAGRDAAAALHPNPALAAPRPLIRGRLGPNYNACNVIYSRQLARHGVNVGQAAAGVDETRQPEEEHEQAPPGVVANHVIETVIRTLVRMARAHWPSNAASRKCGSHYAFDHSRTLPSTPGRQTPLYGWKISNSPTEPEGRMMTTASSSTSPSASGSTFKRGSNSCRPTASVVELSSSRFSSGTSRERTNTLKTPGTSRAASRSLASPCGTTSAGSPGSPILYLTSLMQTSSAWLLSVKTHRRATTGNTRSREASGMAGGPRSLGQRPSDLAHTLA
jgi:hypothetical protein